MTQTHREAGIEPSDAHRQPRRDTLLRLLRYKGWADARAYDALVDLPEGEATKPRQTIFGTMAHTMNHIHVIDDIFRHHLCGTSHGYTARNTQDTPPLADLRVRARAMNQWYRTHVEQWRDEHLDQRVAFTFVGGGEGCMTKEDIVLHLVNHATYHRGFVGDMLRQVPYAWASNDLTVFLREGNDAVQPIHAVGG